MNRNTWKGHERTVAYYFDTIRNPLSGGNSRVTRSDSRHETLYIELKSGKGVPHTWKAIEKLFLDTEEKAVKEGKIPIVVLKPAGTSANVQNWTCYARIPDGTFSGAIVGLPLRVIKALLDANKIAKPLPPYEPLDLGNSPPLEDVPTVSEADVRRLARRLEKSSTYGTSKDYSWEGTQHG